MKKRKKDISPKEWIDQIFAAKIVKKNGIVRRKVASVEKFASRQALIDEINRMGFHAVQIGDQWVIICNKDDISLML